MQQCWSPEPSTRPTFRDLREVFEAMLLQTKYYLQFSPLTEGSVHNRGLMFGDNPHKLEEIILHKAKAPENSLCSMSGQN